MRSLEMTLEGVPVSKGRPRLSMRGGFARAYTPAKTRQAEDKIKAATVGLQPFREGALCLTVRFFMPIPKSTSKKERARILAQPQISCTRRPDLDNLTKLLMDGLADLFTDDAQIVRISASKEYSDYPRTELALTELCE